MVDWISNKRKDLVTRENGLVVWISDGGFDMSCVIRAALPRDCCSASFPDVLVHPVVATCVQRMAKVLVVMGPFGGLDPIIDTRKILKEREVLSLK